MYLVMVYDVSEERVSKVLKVARKYLNWIQNSVLEGEITDANLLKLKKELKEVIDENYDSVIFYILPNKKNLIRDNMGVLKNSDFNII
ncbi:MAG: CRISPR-associated endonuclease Cas2 [bacterium]|nr:CRISPR-associated endonuclease Cas2 [bacterium]